MITTHERSSGRLGGFFARISAAVSDRMRSAAVIESSVSAHSPWRAPSFFPPADASAAITGHAAARWQAHQSWLPIFVQDARQDISPGDRIEILRRARYCDQWSALFNKILTLIDTNVVGSGITPTPMSSSKRFNARMADYWEEISSKLDLAETIPFPDMQGIIARTRAVDGEIFAWLTYADEEKTLPRVRLVESHRVVSAQLPVEVRAALKEGYKEFDGILFDARDVPRFYFVTNDADAFSKERPSRGALIPREQMVHFFKPRRAGQPRGLSLFAPVLHDEHDKDDLQQFEMIASKDAASITRRIYNEAGEKPTGDTTAIRRRKTGYTDAGAEQDMTAHSTRAFGSKTVYMKHGDRAELETPRRPTAAQQEFWDRLDRKCSQGTGISLAAIMDYAGAWGGAAARGAVMCDNRFYDQYTWSLIPGFQRIYEHVGDAGIRSGRLGTAPADWRKAEWNTPRRATVDIGRDGKQLLLELEAGIRTESQLIGELGYDRKAILKQRVSEVRERLSAAKELAAEFGLQPMQAYALLSKPPQGLPLNEAAPAEEGTPAPNGNGNGRKTEPATA